jgi:hypothetical protein
MKLKPLAVAVAAALPVAALAATLTAPATNQVSTEFLATQSAVNPGASSIALGSQYAVGDIITLSFGAAPLANGSTTAYVWPNTLDVVVNATEASNGAGVVSLFDTGDTSVSYRVTTAPAIAGGTIAIPGDIDIATSAISGDITLSSSSQTGTGTAFDAGAAVKYVDVNGSQFAYTIGGLTQIVDVESDRAAFTDGASATKASHAINIAVDSNVGTSDDRETAGAITVTLNGDFSWLDANTATSATGIELTNIGGTNVTAAAAGATQITVSMAAAGGTIVLTNSLGLVIPTQTLSLSLSQALSVTTATASAAASGTYTNNGSTVTVYAMPTSSAVSNFIWLTNNGSSDGEVSLTVYDAGTTVDLGAVGTSAAGTNFDVTAALAAALEAQGVTLSGGRVHMDIVTKVPAADVAVSAAYRVGDDRVNLLTSLETDHD